MKRLTLFIFFILLSCSKDSPIPDAPTPTVTYTLSVSASEGGTVNNTGGTHNANSSVSITATADAGYEFTSWSGDASGTDNPLTVSMNSNKTITANFIRTQYTLNVGQVGEGTITQEVISSGKTSEEYNSGDVVRLKATPSSGSIFNSWSGSSTETTNQIDVTIDGTKSVTATFEETISQVLAANDTFPGVGKWKIREKTVGTDTSKSANCELLEIIFRTDGSFTIVTGTTTVTGQFIIDSNTTISLTQSQSPFGTITNLVLTNNFISFSLSLNTGCSEDAEGDRDDTYDEDTDTSLPPVISLIGSSTINLEVGDTFTDPGATASDNIDGDLTSSITSSGTVNTATEGTYTIEYSVSDAAGNIASVSRTVIVSLDLPPTITLTGSSTINLTVGDTFTDPGATATDDVDGNLTSSITTSGAISTSNTGTFTISYSVSDAAGNSASVQRTVIVSAAADTTPPVISLLGSSTINLTVGDTFTDPGATATDEVDGDLTSSITTSGSVDTSTAGTYIISYNVSDAAGNAATQVERTIIVSVVSSADFDGPSFGSITVSPTNIDITSGPVTVAVTVQASDVTGIDAGMIFSNRTGFSGGNPSSNANLGGWELSSGTLQNGEFTATTVFNPSENTPGSYSLGGFTFWDTNDFTSQFPQQPNVLTVINSLNYSISVTANSNADYTLSGTDVNGAVSGDDASITINAGDTLNFTVDAASHPFYIKTAQGTGTDNQASNVTNNGATNGVVSWTPTTAGTYYYQCSVHDGMYGTITVQ